MLEPAAYKGVIDFEHPFGPTVSEQLRRHPLVSQEFFDTGYKSHIEESIVSPTIIKGRKGSGKTAFMKAESTWGTNLVIELDSSECFHSIINTLKQWDPDADTLYVQEAENLWDAAIWAALMAGMVNRGLADELSPEGQRVVTFIGALVGFRPVRPQGAFSRLCASLGHQAPHDILALKTRGIRLYEAISSAEALLAKADTHGLVLLDSIDDQQQVLSRSPTAIAGLLRLNGDKYREKFPYFLRLAVPTELFEEIKNCATNNVKDFEGLLTLKWTASDLIRVASHRFSRYIRLHFPEEFKESAFGNLDLGKPEVAEQVFRASLPAALPNSIGGTEDGLAYILRHTQLLPRHFIFILNRIWRDRTSRRNPFDIAPSVIRRAIESCEVELAEEICTAYRPVYPKVSEICAALFPELTMCVSEAELHTKFNSFARATSWGMNSDECRNMLIDIGAIGRFVKKTDFYIEAEFKYYSQNLGISEDETLCLHPLFLGKFGCKEKSPAFGKAALPIYPRGWDPDTTDDWGA